MFRRWWWVLLVTCFLMPFIGMMVSAVVTYVMPKMFESSVTFEIKPQANPPQPLSIPEEMTKIVSGDIVWNAVRTLDFDKKWALPEDEAVALVKRSVTVSQLPGTDRIRLTARHVNKEDARDMAEGMVMSYMDDLRTIRSGGDATSPASRGSYGDLGLSPQHYEDVIVHQNPIICYGPSPNVGLEVGLFTGPVLGFLLMLALNRVWPAGQPSPAPFTPSAPVEY